MRKRILCLLLCALLSFCLPLSVLATPDETEEAAVENIPETTFLSISSADDFLAFAEKCRLDTYSQYLVVTLTADIDLKHVPFAGIPIFCGVFDGNGHTISGLSVTAEGSVQGLFRYVTAGAVIKNLTVKGSLYPQGSRNIVGGIVGENAGLIESCTFSGTVSASDKVGGIAGVNKVTGIITRCQTDGSIQGDHFIGGITGENMGVVRHCTNSSAVNITPQQNNVELSDITLDAITTSEAANTVTDIGGIAGTSGGVIRNCDNLADIGYRHMGYNIGGIVGSQMGYVRSCQNFGQVFGRKEVGGIVGQMEPVTNIVYTVDTLQILQGQLDTMGALAGRASATAQNSANAVTGQIAAMQEYTETAKDAVGILLPQNGNLIPDADQIQAATSALNSSFTGMQNSVQTISDATQNAAEALSQDLRALTSQIGAMGATLKEAPENIGGTIQDISDLDTPEDTTGKVENCHNQGPVLADLNAGGIAGAIAPENDLDPDEDVDVTGQESLNFDSELRAVILSCSNISPVSVSKQGGGGIAGRMALGLVKDCTNTGSVTGDKADYMGGIVGQSIGFIRNCYAKAMVSGSSYVGGIAGTANTVSDCRSVPLLSAVEKQGAVLGFAEDRSAITGNYYCTLSTDPGAIDGISYGGCAQPSDLTSFLNAEEIPDTLKAFTVSFIFEDGTAVKKTVTIGQPLQQKDIPALPEKEGYTGRWEGLDGLEVFFDATIQAVYTPYATVTASETLRKDDRPVLLVEGSFQPGDIVSLQVADRQPPLQKRQALADLQTIVLPESVVPITVRYLPPENTAPDTLLYQDASGSWRTLSYTVDGSYYVFAAPADSFTIAAIETAPFPWIWYAAAAGVLVFGLAVILLIKKKHR